MEITDEDFDEMDVIIIGAGVSGLTAAYQLWKKDPSLRVLVLEAKDRIGGRTVGQELQGANGAEKWDLGGQWVGSTQLHILALLKELSLDTVDEHTTGKKVLQLRDNRVRTYTGDIPSLSVVSLIDLHLFVSKAERLVKSFDINNPETFPLMQQWNNMTFEDLKNKMLWTRAARQVVDASGRCMFGVEASQMSALYYIYYAAAAGGVEPLISAKKSNGGQGMKVKGGTWQVCHRLLEKIGKDKVQLSSPVARITQTSDEVAVQTISGVEYRSKRLIVALPPHQTARIDFQPSLPVNKLHVIHRMTPGNITKVIVTYKTSFWRAAGFSGEGVVNGGRAVVDNVDAGPLCVIFDAMSARGSPALVGFIGGDQHIQYSKLKPSSRRDAVLHSFSELFGPSALDPLDYAEKNWSEDPYNQGGPVSVMTPGIMDHVKDGLRAPVGRVHFCGTESATVWCGFINGAVQTGYRAANEVLYNLRPQVITSSDLEGTAYDTPRKLPSHGASRTARLVRWSVGLGLVAAAILAVRRQYPRVALW